ncbi:innexin inx2-like [Oratosquilla oratoria]|uniref:innexin inx2-like n=1 Tax=Oratosquilla oratoria TaxID=337810 RepID=UPI003F76D22C
MVFKFLAFVKGLLHFNTELKTSIDGSVFKLHYRWTTSFCFISCLLLVAVQYIGNPIQCILAGKKAPKPMTTYCWISSTFTLVKSSDDANLPHGIGAHDPYSSTHDVIHHNYYQWVPFVLTYLGCLFYLPHLVWKAVEGKRLDRLLQGLYVRSLTEESAKQDNIVRYMRLTWGQNKKYAVQFFISEILNFVNVVGQMYLLNAFLGGFFLEYGTKVFSYLASTDDRRDPLMEVFPRVTKCNFKYYGASGTLQNRDLMCILPQNILSEKIFLFLWVWFVALATVTAAQLVLKTMVYVSPAMRLRMFEHRGKLTASQDIENAVRCMPLGDFFLLDLLGRNLDAGTFKNILQQVCKSVDPAPSAPKHLGALDMPSTSYNNFT